MAAVDERRIGDSVSAADSAMVMFGCSSKDLRIEFRPGELVLVLRSGGGMTYGRIERSERKTWCSDSTAQHSRMDWHVRIQESDETGRSIAKAVPEAMLGKLSHIKREGDHIASRGSGRIPGDPVSHADVGLSCFRRDNKFKVGEIVVVPRSRGGKPCNFSLNMASSGTAHTKHLVGYEVKLAPGTESGMILPSCMGKLIRSKPHSAAKPGERESEEKVRPEEKARAAEEKARAGVERMEDKDLDDEEVIVMRAAPPAPAPPPMPLPPQEPHFVEYGLVGAIGGENEAQELWPTLSQAVAMPAPAAASAPIIEPPSSVVVGTGEGVARRGEVDISCVAMLTQLLQEKVVNRSGKRRRPIVLDASNVAVALGKSKTFEVRGIVEALRYWIKRGHRTVGFIPHWRVHGRIFENTKARPMAPEQQPLLRALVEAELLHTTPSQDYDDSYIIEFARQTKAYVVSNDQFRDWVDKQPSSERKEAAAAWVTKHVMTYTFVGTDFFPNPDFALQAAKDSGFDKTES